MKSGNWTGRSDCYNQKVGKLLAASRANRLGGLRAFFRDLQESGLIARRFDAQSCFTTPKTLLALITPNPRVIADDVWAKLLWAELNLTAEDLPDIGQRAPGTKRTWYPIELMRVVVITWLFAGLRINEILRLRVGCIRWRRSDVAIPGALEVLAKDAVCFLDVPVHKTEPAFTKPRQAALQRACSSMRRCDCRGLRYSLLNGSFHVTRYC